MQWHPLGAQIGPIYQNAAPTYRGGGGNPLIQHLLLFLLEPSFCSTRVQCCQCGLYVPFSKYRVLNILRFGIYKDYTKWHRNLWGFMLPMKHICVNEAEQLHTGNNICRAVCAFREIQTFLLDSDFGVTCNCQGTVLVGFFISCPANLLGLMSYGPSPW